MKTLSLYQPWAQLVVIGSKKFETRSWATNYRGPLLIHASKRFTREDQLLMFTWPFFDALKGELPDVRGVNTKNALPTGGLIRDVTILKTIAALEAAAAIVKRSKP